MLTSFRFSNLNLLLLSGALIWMSSGCGKGEDARPPGEGPRVVETDPAEGAQLVARNATISVVFDSPVKSSTLRATTFYLAPDSPGAVGWDEETLTATLTPSQPLEARTIYTVHLTTGITAPDGTPLREAHSFRFSTVDEPAPAHTRASTHTFGNDTVTVTVSDAETLTRTYTIGTTANLRDNDPADKRVTFTEREGQMILRSGNDLYDALFAMAVEETRQLSVSSISDGAFNNGQGVPCDCFETGAKWNYVWTRDTAYAVDLGLAFADPTRSKNSLDFKLSERKGGGGVQIVQDTGSGGSYPVSTDRVVWAIGAWEVLKFLHGPERETFRDKTLEAMKNTIAQDRQMVFDPRDGLYRGEQSFLDWREQSYPSYTANDTVHIAMSKTLSTNVGHYALLRFAAALAGETGDGAARAQYATWAEELAGAINRELWLEGAGMYSAMKTTELDDAALHKYDLLGLSLAILQDLPGEERTASIVRRYPHSTMGPPVLWPQQPLIPIYHNRGIWPFVTAYALLAARTAGNAAVFDHDFESLTRGAAVNLSNMENFEFLTLGNWVDDGEFSGPVVNSRRQLWSVAGYLGAIVKGVFGLEATQEEIHFEPFLTAAFRNSLEEVDGILLSNIPYRGKVIDVEIRLPSYPIATGGALQIASTTLNGAPHTGGVSAAALGERNIFVITLTGVTDPPGEINVVEDSGDFRRFWAPREPTLTSLALEGDRLKLDFHASGEEGVVFHIFRDGKEVAANLSDGSWIDPNSADHATRTYCYAIESVFTSSGNRSHHSPVQCYWGADTSRVKEFPLHRFRHEGGTWSTAHDRPHYMNWGRPEHLLEITHLRPQWTGPHHVQFTYGNGAGSIPTGITAAVKEVTMTRHRDQSIVTQGYVIMPQLGDWSRWGESTLLAAELDGDEVYSLTLSDGINMSYFAHFEPYTGGMGGGRDTYNMVNIASMKLLAMGGTDRRRPTGGLVPFDGNDDLGKFQEARRDVPGAPSQPWSAFALDTDEDYLYFAMVSEAFEDPYKPLMIYIEALDDAEQGASPSQGMPYSELTPQLPINANLMITARQRSDDGSEGPWNGVWRRGEAGWQRQQRLEAGVDWWLAGDNHTISLRIPRDSLATPGRISPARIRLVAHIVNALAEQEWKDTVPSAHTPWSQGGDYLTIAF